MSIRRPAAAPRVATLLTSVGVHALALAWVAQGESAPLTVTILDEPTPEAPAPEPPKPEGAATTPEAGAPELAQAQDPQGEAPAQAATSKRLEELRFNPYAPDVMAHERERKWAMAPDHRDVVAHDLERKRGVGGMPSAQPPVVSEAAFLAETEVGVEAEEARLDEAERSAAGVDEPLAAAAALAAAMDAAERGQAAEDRSAPTKEQGARAAATETSVARDARVERDAAREERADREAAEEREASKRAASGREAATGLADASTGASERHASDRTGTDTAPILVSGDKVNGLMRSLAEAAAAESNLEAATTELAASDASPSGQSEPHRTPSERAPRARDVEDSRWTRATRPARAEPSSIARAHTVEDINAGQPAALFVDALAGTVDLDGVPFPDGAYGEWTTSAAPSFDALSASDSATPTAAATQAANPAARPTPLPRAATRSSTPPPPAAPTPPRSPDAPEAPKPGPIREAHRVAERQDVATDRRLVRAWTAPVDTPDRLDAILALATTSDPEAAPTPPTSRIAYGGPAADARLARVDEVASSPSTPPRVEARDAVAPPSWAEDARSRATPISTAHAAPPPARQPEPTRAKPPPTRTARPEPARAQVRTAPVVEPPEAGSVDERARDAARTLAAAHAAARSVADHDLERKRGITPMPVARPAPEPTAIRPEATTAPARTPKPAPAATPRSEDAEAVRNRAGALVAKQPTPGQAAKPPAARPPAQATTAPITPPATRPLAANTPRPAQATPPPTSPAASEAPTPATPPAVQSPAQAAAPTEGPPEAPTALVNAATPPPAPPPKPAAPAAGSGGEGEQTVLRRLVSRWLRYVRTDGAPAASASADARYIGGRNVVVAREHAAPTNTTRSFGSGKEEAEALPGTKAPTPATDAALGLADGEAGAPDGLIAELPVLPDAAAPATQERMDPTLRLGMVLEDPLSNAEVVEVPTPRAAAPRANLPRPTHRAPQRDEDGADTTASPPTPEPAATTGADAPMPDDDFWSPAPAAPPISGVTERDGRAWSSLEVVDDLPLDETAAVHVRQTPLGVWMDDVDRTLRRRLVYPAELRALEVRGTVTVRFRVDGTGTVHQAEITAGSGEPALDTAAIAAIPSHVDPPPEGHGDVPISWTFRFGKR